MTSYIAIVIAVITLLFVLPKNIFDIKKIIEVRKNQINPREIPMKIGPRERVDIAIKILGDDYKLYQPTKEYRYFIYTWKPENKNGEDDIWYEIHTEDRIIINTLIVQSSNYTIDLDIPEVTNYIEGIKDKKIGDFTENRLDTKLVSWMRGSYCYYNFGGDRITDFLYITVSSYNYEYNLLTRNDETGYLNGMTPISDGITLIDPLDLYVNVVMISDNELDKTQVIQVA